MVSSCFGEAMKRYRLMVFALVLFLAPACGKEEPEYQKSSSAPVQEFSPNVVKHQIMRLSGAGTAAPGDINLQQPHISGVANISTPNETTEPHISGQ